MPSGKPKQAGVPRTTVFRANKPAGGDARYSRILNDVLQNEALSFKARGIFAYVLSMPPHWRHSARRLSGKSREGVDAIQAGLRELSEHGYMDVKKERTPEGTIQTTLIFRESPEREKPGSAPKREKPGPGEPRPGQPGSGEPAPGKSRSFETTVRNYDGETTNAETTLSLGEGECERIKDAWNATCSIPRMNGSSGRPRWERVTNKQRQRISVFLGDGRTVEDFQRVFNFIWGDDFHNGEGPRTHWTGATPSWLLKDDNFQTTLERADHQERKQIEESPPADVKF